MTEKERSGSTISVARSPEPLILTYMELEAVLGPIALGNKWAEGCIHDLWKMGAPTPQSRVGTPSEKRIIFPKQLFKWLETTLNESGKPLDEGADAYVDLLKRSATIG